MERADIVVAEVDGALVAVHCAAFPVVSIGGVEQRVNYIHHLRIAPEFQRRRLLGRIKEVAVPRYAPDSTTSYAYVDVTNPLSANMRRSGTAHLWSVTPLSCEIDVRAHGGPARGRPASPDDAAQLVQVLNERHQGEEFWRPLTAELLAARLERATDQYSWGSVWIHDGAVLGVWPAGLSTRVITSGPEGRTEVRQGVVLDYGYPDGGEDAFAELVAASGSRLAALGLDRLVIFTYDGSPVHTLLEPLSARIRRFDLWTTAFGQPEGASAVHVDPIYF